MKQLDEGVETETEENDFEEGSEHIKIDGKYYGFVASPYNYKIEKTKSGIFVDIFDIRGEQVAHIWIE
jgi:hypothetical protein